MNYKYRFEKQKTLYEDLCDAIQEQLEMIDDMAKDMERLRITSKKEFEPLVCQKIEKENCPLRNGRGAWYCKSCIKNFYLNQVIERRNSEKIGKIITYDDGKHPVKVFLNGSFYGDTDEYETLIYDFFKMTDYDDLEFDDIDASTEFWGLSEDMRSYIMNWFNYTLEMDYTEQKLIKNRDWEGLYDNLTGDES